MKKITIVFSILLLVLAAAGISMAGSVPAPTELEGVNIIPATEVKSYIDKKDMQVFDMRKALNYGKGHLPGAVSLPYKWTKKGHPAERTGKFDITKLPADKSQNILFHSDGPTGWKSYYASIAAIEAGYKNVYWMREGFAGWKNNNYPVAH